MIDLSKMTRAQLAEIILGIASDAFGCTRTRSVDTLAFIDATCVRLGISNNGDLDQLSGAATNVGSDDWILEIGRSARDGTAIDAVTRDLCVTALGLGSPMKETKRGEAKARLIRAFSERGDVGTAQAASDRISTAGAAGRVERSDTSGDRPDTSSDGVDRRPSAEQDRLRAR